MSFQNQTVAITGGNSGIGRAAAADFANKGAKVAIMGRTEATVRSTASQLGVSGFAGDTTNSADLKRFFASVAEETGKIDVLVANAGIAEFLPFEASDLDHFERTMAINFLGTVATIKAALPYLASPSSIVLTTSIASQLGEPNTSAYSASKAAMGSLVRTLSRELLSKGIRLNAVSPGPTKTPIFEKMGLAGEVLDQTQTALSGAIPAGRMGTDADQANAILFLASHSNDFIVGQELTVDGGVVGCATIGA